MQFEKVKALVEDAKLAGATVHAGGAPLDGEVSKQLLSLIRCDVIMSRAVASFLYVSNSIYTICLVGRLVG